MTKSVLNPSHDAKVKYGGHFLNVTQKVQNDLYFGI